MAPLGMRYDTQQIPRVDRLRTRIYPSDHHISYLCITVTKHRYKYGDVTNVDVQTHALDSLGITTDTQQKYLHIIPSHQDTQVLYRIPPSSLGILGTNTDMQQKYLHIIPDYTKILKRYTAFRPAIWAHWAHWARKPICNKSSQSSIHNTGSSRQNLVLESYFQYHV
ncbi:hypothetical protein EAF00_008869 [Botryotinia globosa]|nr:hypothetical protein EAF00_008869 [Botryotinia globosa]